MLQMLLQLDWQAVISLSFLLDPFVFMFVLISNFILYSVLKKKYNFELNVFLYGVGFTSCCVMFELFTLTGFILLGLYDPFGGGIEVYFYHILSMLLFTSLYYSYATFLQNKEKEISRVTLYLTAITGISFAVLIIFEIIQYRIPYAGIIPFLFILYLAYCLIHKKGLLNLRGFAWSPFIPSSVMFGCVLLYALIITPF